MSKQKNWVEEYIKQEEKRMNSQPEFIRYSEKDYSYIIVKDTPENIEKFNKVVNGAEPPSNTFVYFNEPEMYDKLHDVIKTNLKLKKHREQQEKINNPKIWEEVKDIDNKDKLIEYLVDYWSIFNKVNIDEYSNYPEVDMAEFEVTQKELQKKIEELL